MGGLYLLYSETMALISCAVIAQLICAFAFAYAKCRFSHDAAHIKSLDNPPSTDTTRNHSQLRTLQSSLNNRDLHSLFLTK